ncbi:hypothetical protein [Frankia sp. CiP3]|uniref:hypothetical protein n=1 Tax=Frankia sp. CiP3 TaxID=2880971 RepID=UPI001EF42718|nr:hypothetical protein [Frankia sp. CiP3]
MTEPLSAGEDIRLTVPLYSLAEAARCLALRPTTFGRWARGYTWVAQGGRQVHRSPVVTALPAPFRGGPSVPFIGLAEGLVLAAFRQAHVPLQQIRPALEFLRDEVGLDHALASRRLYLVGAELLWDYAQHDDADPRAVRGVRELVAIRSGQRVFAEVVDRYLRLITYADDDLAEHIQLPGYETAIVAADTRMNFGQPYFVHGGVPLDSVLSRHRAGEPLEDLADDYGIPLDEIADAVDVADRPCRLTRRGSSPTAASEPRLFPKPYGRLVSTLSQCRTTTGPRRPNGLPTRTGYPT